MKIASVAEMRKMDAAVIAKLGIAEEILMENAGLAALRLLLARQPDLTSLRTLVVCASGNNGGDGFVLARQLHSLGGAVQVLMLGDRKKCKGAALANLMALSAIPAIRVNTVTSLAQAQCALHEADIIVDALLGTGLDRAVAGIFAETIKAINHSGKFVLSLDIPSGINGDTGQVMGAAVRANCTVAFGVLKRGLLLYPGFEHCGELHLARISFPTAYHSPASIQVAVNEYIPLPLRPAQAHKKSVGAALIVAGSVNYLGAPYLAAAAFLRAGGGYARLVTTPAVVPSTAARCPEIVFSPMAETDGALAAENLPTILELAAMATMLLVGSGMSLQKEAQSLALALIKKAGCPIIVDGDGISALADSPKALKTRRAATIITPHSGELAHLLGISVDEVEANRIDTLQNACQSLKAFIVLKGAHSLIGCPDGRVFINLTGNPGMATAGAGDVLTGVIAAMYGAGLPLEEALCKAVYLHGLAGDLARERKGEAGMIASDILESLPEAIKIDGRLGKNTRAVALL